MLEGCVWRTFVLAVLVGLLALAWLHGPDLWLRLGPRATAPEGTSASLRAAEEAEARIAGLLEGRENEIRLTEPELEGLLVHRGPVPLSASLSDLDLTLLGGEVTVAARARTAALLDPPDLRVLIPEYLPVRLVGTLVNRGEGEAAFLIRRLFVARLPVPGLMVRPALETLGWHARPDLPRDAVAVSLPAGVSSAYIDDDELVLVGVSR